MNWTLIAASATVFAASCATPQPGNTCAYDKGTLLSLDEQTFDQDLSNGGGGWRALAGKPGCELTAADLLAEYRAAHPSSSPILAWHEGQLRATAHQYDRAIPLLKSSRQQPSEDMTGWNYYVDATVAFLSGDKERLVRARTQLASVPYPANAGMPPFKDGYIEVPAQGGMPAMKVRWPPNIDVVDGLVRCFGKPYAEAYGACRAPQGAP